MQILIVRALKKSLHSTSRVFRASTIITMRQQYNQSTLSQPLLFTAADICIKNDLSAVKKITKLRFPDVQILWTLQTISIFKTKHCKLTQTRIGHLQLGLQSFNFIQRYNRLLSILIHQHCMALTKSPTANILTRDSDVNTLF